MGRTRQCPVWVIIGQPIRDVRFAPQADMLTVGTSPLNANLGHQSLLLQRTVRPENLDIKRALLTSPPQ